MLWFNFRSILHVLPIWTKSYLIKADNSVVIGEAWRVDIPNMADPTGTFAGISLVPRFHAWVHEWDTVVQSQSSPLFSIQWKQISQQYVSREQNMFPNLFTTTHDGPLCQILISANTIQQVNQGLTHQNQYSDRFGIHPTLAKLLQKSYPFSGTMW